MQCVAPLIVINGPIARDGTQTRKKTVPSKQAQSPESLAQIGGPQCSDGNRVGPARIPCPGAVLGYSARIHLECRCTRPTRTPSEVVTNAS